MSYINTYCRLCAERQPKTRLITGCSQIKKKRLDEYIYRYLCIKLDDNNDYPKSVCFDCVDTILNFHTFAKKIEFCQTKLHSLVRNVPPPVNQQSHIKVEPPEYLDEKVALNKFENEIQHPSNEIIHENSTAAWSLDDNDVSNTSVEFKRELDLDHQFENNFENLDSKTAALIENVNNAGFSLENDYRTTTIELNDDKSKKWERTKGFKKYEIWKCYHCNKCHLNLEALQKHFDSVHHAPVEYNCYNCQGLFSDLNEYKSHLSNDHGITLTTDNVAKFKCKICGFATNHVSNFRHHQLTHSGIKKFRCDVCGKRFTLKQQLQSHSLTHKRVFTVAERKVERPDINGPKFSDIFKCFKCDGSFHKLDELDKHFKQTHKDSTAKFYCPRCNKDAASKFEMKEHLKKEHKRYQCRICGKEIANRTSFVSHHYIHEGIKRFSCDVCGKSFALKQHAEVHRMKHEKPLISCEQCDRTFSSEHLYQRHQKSHVLKCQECDICQKKFSSKKVADAHRKLIHERVEKPSSLFVCDQCGKHFKQKGQFVQHSTTHSNVYEYRCDKCPKAFKNVYNLKKHEQVHVMTKAFKCDVCGTLFKHRRTLTRHVRIHTNKLPYECEFCKKCFREKSYLRVHLRQHTGERPYACLECNHYFSNDSNYIKHLRGRHGLENVSIANNPQYPFVNK